MALLESTKAWLEVDLHRKSPCGCIGLRGLSRSWLLKFKGSGLWAKSLEQVVIGLRWKPVEMEDFWKLPRWMNS